MGDAHLRIMDLVARWPGATHDQTVFNNSSLHARYEANEFGDSILMGDSGYALKKYLITPMDNPRTESERLFNEAQIRSRNPIERLFGVWKRRFPILANGIRLSLQTTKATILACAVLHNIAIDRFEDEPPQDPNVQVEADEELLQINVQQENAQFREPFISYFADLLIN